MVLPTGGRRAIAPALDLPRTFEPAERAMWSNQWWEDVALPWNLAGRFSAKWTPWAQLWEVSPMSLSVGLWRAIVPLPNSRRKADRKDQVLMRKLALSPLPGCSSNALSIRRYAPKIAPHACGMWAHCG